MKKSIFSRVKLAGLLVLFVIGFVFAGCKQPQNIINEDISIIGKWAASEYESYEITSTTFKSGYEGDNLVVRYTDEDETSGYIYIKYTKAYETTTNEPTGEDKDTWSFNPANPDWGTSDSWWRYSATAPDVGKWYAISFKDLTDKSVKISGAYGAKSSTETLEEAVAEFTVDKGYFGTYSDCAKQ